MTRKVASFIVVEDSRYSLKKVRIEETLWLMEMSIAVYHSLQIDCQCGVECYPFPHSRSILPSGFLFHFAARASLGLE